MKLGPDHRLAHYEVLGLIGEGGMGEVYRAKDKRLPREVAIKTSRERFTERFTREARVIASLNHPNICTLYDVGPDYLVMELVEGPTLQERIKGGPLPLKDAVTIAQQVAEALEYAHEKGVIHRDLKPGNIKIRPDGVVKVLDFGLAKLAMEPPADGSQAATISAEGTAAGIVVGTAAYMSPEQAMGKSVDRRTDVFAFGVVFYEMLAGNRLHKGDSAQEVMASVLKDEPDLAKVPPEARRLLRRCLEKDPNRRLRHIGDAMALLDEAPASGPQPAAAPPVAAKRGWLWPAVAALLLIGIAGLTYMQLVRPGPAAQEVRTQIPKPEGLTYNPGTQAAISPDGRWLAFPALGPDNIARMYLRSVASLETQPLPGSEGIIALSPPPFWSDDSRYVVYGAAGKLRKSEINLTPAQTIADTGRPFVQGGTWNRDGIILYANNAGELLQVPASGGTPVPVTALTQGETAHRWPQFLPDGRRFLYLRVSTLPERTGIYVGSLDVMPADQSLKLLLPTDRQVMWVTDETSGKSYLLHQREQTLLAQLFDTGTLELSGTPVAIATDVGAYPAATAGMWSVARTGTLTYRSGGGGLPELVMYDRAGKSTRVGAPLNSLNPTLSPDGTKVAFRLVDGGGNPDIWVRDLQRGADVRLTFDPGLDDYPVWSSDSQRLAFAGTRSGKAGLYEIRVDQSGTERLLAALDQTDPVPTSWSVDGRFLLFHAVASATRGDLWILPLETGKPCPFLQSAANEAEARFSPSGRWIAYQTDSSSVPQIYVRPFSSQAPCEAAAGSLQSMVSTTSGLHPRWSRDGTRLHYLTLNSDLMAVVIDAGANFRQHGLPTRLFGVPALSRNYDVGRTSNFLFLAVPDSGGPPPPFTLVQNWFAALEK